MTFSKKEKLLILELIIKTSSQLGNEPWSKLSQQNIGTLILHVLTFHSFASISNENEVQNNQSKPDQIKHHRTDGDGDGNDSQFAINSVTFLIYTIGNVDVCIC